MSQFRSRDLLPKRKVSLDERISTGLVPSPQRLSPLIAHRRLEAAVKSASDKTQAYECQLRVVESQISTTLSNFRAIDNMTRESYSGLEQHNARANHGLQNQVPYIESELEESAETLAQLNEILPDVDTQVTHIQAMYNSGRKEAEELVENLTWLNTDFYERWRRIIFSDSPVSWRWKYIMRTSFAILFITSTALLCIALAGAYRAHRHRLVWGDKLLS